MQLGAVIVMASLVLGGCAREPSPGPPRAAAGTERGDCRPEGNCEPGLLCLSNLCVRPPPADCQTVADQLASMELGNYADPEQRTPVVARYKAACTTGRVSQEQGACLEKATDKWAAAQCAPSMFPEMQAMSAGDCAGVSAKLKTAMSRQMGAVNDPQVQQMFATALGVVQQSCEQDAWPEMFKKCILLAADTTDALETCTGQMPPALQQKLTERMTAAMQQQMQQKQQQLPPTPTPQEPK